MQVAVYIGSLHMVGVYDEMILLNSLQWGPAYIKERERWSIKNGPVLDKSVVNLNVSVETIRINASAM